MNKEAALRRRDPIEVEITRTTTIGGEGFGVGSIVSLEPALAKDLLRRERAVLAPETAEKPAKLTAAEKKAATAAKG